MSWKNGALGMHTLVEFYDCNVSLINSCEGVRQILLEAARIANATVVQDVFHEFNPHGISGVVVIAESHFAFHSWPEHACASIDIFSCSPDMRIFEAVAYMKEAFQAQKESFRQYSRGLLPPQSLPCTSESPA